VLSWNDKKGWGFIKPQDGGEDRFVHYTNVISDCPHKSLHKGEIVNFDVEIGPNNKPQAVNVSVLQKAVA
jgi:cellular nucleic acid-binding protein